MKMNVVYFTFLLFYAFYCVTCTVTGHCEKLTSLSGEIHDFATRGYIKCRTITIPENSYARIDMEELFFSSKDCDAAYVRITANGRSESHTFCSQDTNTNTIIALYDVNVTHYQRSPDRYYGSVNIQSSFRLKFNIESLICVQKNHFRCSPNLCIHKHQVCNDVKDCANGADEFGCEKGLMPINGINDSRIKAINWMKNQRTKSFGWGKNAHRAIIALYLSKALTFQSNDLEEELIVRQLELQTSVALLRNMSDPVSISELSMFVNALTVTCHNPRHFYGYDLLQILSDRLASAKSPVPSAYLTLCNQNWALSDFDIKNLMTLLQKNSMYPFHLDVRALTIMALTCIRNKTENFRNNTNAQSVYESAIQNFTIQLPDGSFGNAYTTALVTQALLSSGQEESQQWNVTAAVRYLMGQMDSPTVDFLSVYSTLPIFSGRSLVDLKVVNCSNKTRKEGKDKEISEVTDKLVVKMQIQYSLYIGDQKDVIHTMFLRMPENSSAYDVMRVAQVADSKYKFLHKEMSGEMYIYEIAGIINDSEDGKFWLLYTDDVNDNLQHHTQSPDKFILGDSDHLIMWYRTAHI